MQRVGFPDASFLSKPQLYGGFGGTGGQLPEAKPFYSRGGGRQRLNMVSVCQCLFFPWLMFCFTYGVTSFSLHHTKPTSMYILLALGLLLVLTSFWQAMRHVLRRASYDMSEPNWHLFLFVTLLAAFVLGAMFGNMNYKTSLWPYYNLKSLNEYSYVDPSKMRGAQAMDAGRVYFVEGAQLDLRRSMGFKNLDTYCVAPITMEGLPLASYDFWAVGKNCCSGNAADFHCGEYLNPNARSGLRFLRDEDRPFLRLAVEQAEATYAIKSDHPLFFYWSEDADSGMEAYRDEGYRFFMLGMIVHFLWQSFCVGLAVCGYSKGSH
eukprot:TRINITY_DN56080_c0_g1_i1.p2 TRINITY_DN56080_c0_g1~~TRINITY_DN56080_c0_g1_i1.p2  ORF type:complete len:321 (-),score=62.54 TRINITY_DN56080_c0_g1_i1:69-1031(-)